MFWPNIFLSLQGAKRNNLDERSEVEFRTPPQITSHKNQLLKQAFLTALTFLLR